MATTENLNTLKIHKLSQEQYDREKEAGRLDNSAIYLTPYESDGSAPSNMVTTDTEQTISGDKTFTQPIVYSSKHYFNEEEDIYVINRTTIDSKGIEYYGYNIDMDRATNATIGAEGVKIKRDYMGNGPEDAPSLYIGVDSGPDIHAQYNVDGIQYRNQLSETNDSEYTLTFPGQSGTIATKEWVNGVIAGKVDYLGIVNSQDELAQLAVQIQSSFDGKDPMKTVVGDYCRAGTAFNLYDASVADYIGEQVHVGDILIYKGTGTAPDAGNWDIIHTEDPGNYGSLVSDNTWNGENYFHNRVSISPASVGGASFDSYGEGDAALIFSGPGGNVTYSAYGIRKYGLTLSIPGQDTGIVKTETIATQEWVDESCERILTAIFSIDEAGTVVDLSNLTASYIDWGDGYINTEHSHEYTVGGVLRTCKIYGVTAINDRAFSNNNSLVSITIGDGVTSIGNSAFLTCSRLTNVTIGDRVSSIGNGAFDNCSSLMSIVIPDSVKSIGGGAFTGCSRLIGVEIGNNVTTIGASAFLGCTSLTSIVIPNSVRYIGDEAFYNCTSLTSVEISNGVTSIGDGAFYNCTSLTSVVIPDSVTSIGNGAFAYCSSLTEITVPFIGMRKNSSVENSTTVFGYIFGYTLSTNTNSIEGTTYQFSNGTNYYHYYIPASLKKVTVTGGAIGANAFYNCSSLTSVTICEGVMSIGNQAFRDCTGLTSVVIPDSVTILDTHAFYGCTNLLNVVIGDGVEVISTAAFLNCSNLTEILLSDSVKQISLGAFNGCSSLTRIELPSKVTDISYQAFKDCSSLTSITIPDSVTIIGHEVFKGCNNLTEITIPFIGNRINSSGYSAVFGYIFGYTTSQSAAHIEGTTYQHNDGTNYYHYYIPTSLKKVTVTSGTIGSYAFNNCNKLTSVVIGDGVTSIGDCAFALCDNLTSVEIGDGVTSIGAQAFYGCINLTSITIPNSVTSIGSSAFQGCTSLTSVVISDSVTEICYDTFLGCSSLTNIEIPNSVTSIGSYAFDGCRGLTRVVIPNSVISISEGTFQNCTRLTSVVIGNNVTSIGTGAFNGCTSLTSVVIGDSVTSISDFVFYGCSSLESVVIPDNVTSIGHEAFCDCDSLTEITIPFVGATKDGTSNSYFGYIFGNVPETLKKVIVTGGAIATHAFSGCDSLTSVELRDDVTNIGSSAFPCCDSLTSVVIGSGVTSVGYGAFDTCSSLTVYCEAESMSSGWAAGWDSTVNHIVWGYKKHVPAIENNIYNHLYAQELHAENSVELGLVEGKDSIGLIRNGSEVSDVTSTTGYTACPIVGGVPYYKGVNSSISPSTLYLIGATTTGNTSAITRAASGVSVTNGQLTADSFCANSDLRLKENITEFKPQTSILELPIVEFDFKETGTHQIGCIAQDLQKICPEIVEQGSDGFLKIQESKIVYLLLDEVRKLRAELDQLKEGKN